MQKDSLNNSLHLHFIVIIFGFTAILGALISIEALPLVWYRMSIASLLVFLLMFFLKISFRISRSMLLGFVIAGVLIALHWATFFHAIKVSSVSLTLSILSSGALFTAFLEPLFYRRKIIGYEVLFGLLVIAGLVLVLKTQVGVEEGIFYAFISIILSVFFTLVNGKFAQKYDARVISFYELLTGTITVSLILAFTGGFTPDFFQLSSTDWIWLLVLALVCTAYAFIVSIKVMKFVSPYSVMLAINMEPVYGILLAYFIFKETETMPSTFYFGTLLIVISVLLNGFLKLKTRSN